MPSKKQSRMTLPDLMRGVAGGSILGVPLLYTQEIWVHGASLDPFVILLVLTLSILFSAGLAHYVGFQRGNAGNPFEAAAVAGGMSLILAGVLLFMLDRIQFDMPAAAFAGTIALSASPIALGFAVGNALAPRSGGEGSERMTGAGGDLLAAAGGATFLALNIAPTEEPILLAGELGWERLSACVLASLVLPYLMVFYAEFDGVSKRTASDGATQGPVTETLLAYLVALVLSAVLLAAFGRTEAIGSIALTEAVVLAFPASIGAALGRMLV